MSSSPWTWTGRSCEKSERLKNAQAVAFIQCVGSRIPERPYCNKVCCAHSVENAIKLKVMNPEMDVYVLYRDMRTYGERETLYTRARETGGGLHPLQRLAIRPRWRRADGRLKITVTDQILQRPVSFIVDFLTLATAIIPHQNAPLAELYKIPLNAEGFFTEAHAKIRPVEASTEGIFMAGLCHYPKPMQESVAEALACACPGQHHSVPGLPAAGIHHLQPHRRELRRLRLLRGHLPLQGHHPDRVHEGRRASRRRWRSTPIQCKGCGSCMATCPKQGIYVAGFTPEQLGAQVEAALGLI